MKFKLAITISLILVAFAIFSCSTSVIEKVEPPQEEVTYVANIKTIIDANCVGCHGAISPVAGVDLTTYALVRTKTEAGRVIARVTSTSSPMPPAPNPRLTDADIALIQQWISDGYKEN